jgi:hypothetical protein
MASVALARAVEKRVRQKSEMTASASESGVEANAEATKRREASATTGTCGARRRGWKEGGEEDERGRQGSRRGLREDGVDGSLDNGQC